MTSRSGKKISMLQEWQARHPSPIWKKRPDHETPSPAIEPPPDIHGDIHLMAMTILEKLQPVLLNAIYTELMEHKK